MTTLHVALMQCLHLLCIDLAGFWGDQYPYKNLEGYVMVSTSVCKLQLLVEEEKELNEAKLPVYQDAQLEMTNIVCQLVVVTN